MSDEGFDRKIKVSEFNEASYQILRLHNLWTKCTYYSTKGMLDEWRWTLDRVWIELSADASGNKKKYFNKNRILNLKIALAKDSSKLYEKLQDKEMFLRTLQEDVGKGGKKSEQYEKIM